MGFNRITEEGGSALAAVLILTALLLMLGGILIGLSLNEHKIVAYREEELSLYYLTEAGIEVGLAALNADYFFTGPLSGVLGGGRFQVEISPLPENRRLVTATGYLNQGSLQLSAIAGCGPLYERALLITRDLEIENLELYGDLHVNRNFRIKGSNQVSGIGGKEGGVSYSREPPIFVDPWGDITIGNQLYTASCQFDDRRMKVVPIPLPNLNFESLGSHGFQDLPPSTGILNNIAALYPGHKRFRVEGDLIIAPGEGETFDFEGLLLVKGDVRISSGLGREVSLNGCLLVKGDIDIDGGISRGGGDNALFLASDGDISIENFESPLVFGGTLYLLTPGKARICSEEEGRLNLRGAIAAGDLALTNCYLIYEPEMPAELRALLPERVTLEEWIRPGEEEKI